MNLSQMKNVVTNFIKNDDNVCILINGIWGVGKTHTLLFDIIKPYQECNSQSVKFAYSSLFGKKKIEEVNTELYSLLHPKATKLMNLISPVIKLIDSGFSLSGININFNPEDINLKKQNKKIKNKKTIVILDDLERINTKFISHKEIMGYINDLTTQGIKVIVLANLDELGESKEYEDYKEKVFDRIYHITSSDSEVYDAITQKNSIYVNKTIIEIIDDNLRILKKSNTLFNQIEAYIKNKNFSFNEWNDLFLLCCYVTMEIMSNKYSNRFIQENSKDVKYYKEYEIKVVAFEKYIKNRLYYGKLNYTNYIFAILDVLESEDYSIFDELFSLNSKAENPLYFESIFYLSDKDKLDVIKQQYDYIKQINYLSSTEKNNFRNVLQDWYKYCEDLPAFINEQVIFEKLNQLNMTFYKTSDNKRFHKFIDEFNKYNKEVKLSKTISMFNKYPETQEEFENIYDILMLKQEEYIIKEIGNQLIQNDFFITKIHGTTSANDWELAHNVCRFISADIPSLKNDLLKYLEQYMAKYPKDKSLKERATLLIENYDLKNTDL